MAPSGGHAAAKSAKNGEKKNPAKRKRSENPTNVAIDNKINDKNIYSELSDDDEMDCESVYSEVKKSTKTPPPITVTNKSISELKTVINNIKDLDTSQIKYKITHNGIKIYTDDIERYKTVKQNCLSNKVLGYSHTPRDERHVKVCLYGLWAMQIQELLVELKEVDIEPTDIKQLTLKTQRYTDQAIYLLYFQQNQHITLEKLRAVRGLFNVIVEWKYYKNKNKEPTQCSNCQKFGHGAKNCFSISICVRCAGQHASKECPLLPKPAEGDTTKSTPKIAEELLHCALCKKKGHTASFRNCEERVKFKELQQSLRNKQNAQRQRSFNTNIHSRVQYPAPPPVRVHPLSTSYHIYRPVEPQPSTSAWQSNIRSKNTMLSPEECLNVFDIFTSELLKCRSIEEQIRTIAKLSFEQVSKYLTPNLQHGSK